MVTVSPTGVPPGSPSQPVRPLLLQFPAQIQTLALVERTHKIFPIALNYVGLSVSTTKKETIVVTVTAGEVAGAYIKTT